MIQDLTEISGLAAFFMPETSELINFPYPWRLKKQRLKCANSLVKKILIRLHLTV